MKRKLTVFALLLLVTALLISACGNRQNAAETSAVKNSAVEASETAEAAPEEVSDEETVGESAAPEFEGLIFESVTPLKYAECFTIYNYADGYKYIEIPDSGNYMVIPEDADVPANIDEDVIIIQQPLKNVYLAATSAYALFDAIDADDCITMTGTQADGWYIDSMVEHMNAGEITYTGKYSEPDYEALIQGDCRLAIESTMIYHTPKVQEMIEDLDIPVMVDRSSYEPNPLGRTEWVKVYGAITGHEAEAEAFFDGQAAVIDELKNFQNTGLKVAYFSVNQDGSVVIRNPADYIPTMISIGGGVYAFADMVPDTDATSFSISMEEFYNTALDADYLIYNGSIESPLNSVDDLIAKDALFADFKAVMEGNVWSTGKDFYQHTDTVGQMIRDINLMLTGSDTGYTFIYHVD